MLLRCESLEPPMSQSGHTRSFGDVCSMSALDRFSDSSRTSPEVRGVPLAVIAAIRRTGVTEYLAESRGSLRLDVGGPDHLAPLFGFVGDEFAEFARRARKHGAAKVSKARSRPAPSVGEADDLKIERQLIFVRSAERIGIDRSSAAREQRLLVSDAALTREGCKRIRQAVRQER